MSRPAAAQRPAAVLWDMDGTLVDTEPYWFAAERRLVASYGGTWTDDHARALVGNPLEVSAAYLRRHGGVPLPDRAIVERLLDDVVVAVMEHCPWRPGALDLLHALHDAGVPTALVTMSWRRLVEPVLAALPPDLFDVVVSGDEVRHGKPHPEPYLRAAAALRVPPGDCLAIEDSATGAMSAEAAGCAVLVVPHIVPVPAGARRTHATSLADLDLAALRALM